MGHIGIHNAIVISIHAENGADTPPTLDGVWTRRSLSVDGQVLPQDSQVTWAQLGPWFVDLRSPGESPARPAAFSGRVIWEPPKILFLRDLDLDASGPEDAALLEIDEDQLVERGEVKIGARSLSYVEVWSRRRPASGPRIVLEGRTADNASPAGRLIQFGDVLVALVAREPDGVQAIALEAAGDGWRALHQVGALEQPPAGGVAAGHLWAGLTWTPAA